MAPEEFKVDSGILLKKAYQPKVGASLCLIIPPSYDRTII